MKTITSKKTRKTVRTASKTSAAYWAGKIRLEKKPGWESSNYFVRIQAHGIRRKMKLDSTVREDAAREAASVYLDIFSNGWPKEEGAPLLVTESSELPENPTIEEWFNVVKAKHVVADATISKYFEALQTIVGEILLTPRARKPEQRAKIKGYLVSGLTKPVLKKWLDGRVASARKLDVVASKRALSTTRSVAINAKSLFSPDALEAIGIDTNTEEMLYVPFSGLRLPSKGQERYSSRIDAKLLLSTARRDFCGRSKNTSDDDDPKFEQWKILYLALVAGLRLKEIDRLRTQDIMISTRRISIIPHATFSPKTKASVGDVSLNASATKVLAAMLERTKGPWFIKADSSTTSKYRTEAHHDAVIEWLRNYEERGVKPLENACKPLHEMRKEAGSLVNRSHGLVATQQFLRHQSITTTAGTYIDAQEANTGLS